MPRSYPPESRRKVLDLLKAGRTVAQLVNDLQISDQTIYTWRRQEAIDTGQLPGITSTDHAELTAARRRIAELETELEIHRRATGLLKAVVPPKHRHAAIHTMAAECLTVEACPRDHAYDRGSKSYRTERPSSPRLGTIKKVTGL